MREHSEGWGLLETSAKRIWGVKSKDESLAVASVVPQFKTWICGEQVEAVENRFGAQVVLIVNLVHIGFVELFLFFVKTHE